MDKYLTLINEIYENVKDLEKEKKELEENYSLFKSEKKEAKKEIDEFICQTNDLDKDINKIKDKHGDDIYFEPKDLKKRNKIFSIIRGAVFASAEIFFLVIYPLITGLNVIDNGDVFGGIPSFLTSISLLGLVANPIFYLNRDNKIEEYAEGLRKIERDENKQNSINLEKSKKIEKVDELDNKLQCLSKEINDKKTIINDLYKKIDKLKMTRNSEMNQMLDDLLEQKLDAQDDSKGNPYVIRKTKAEKD